MLRDEIFWQETYKKLDLNFAKFACNFSTLCRISQMKYKPIYQLKTHQDVIEFARECQREVHLGKKLMERDYFINSAPKILEKLTGKKFKQMQVPDKEGIQGHGTFIPIHYPVPLKAIQIACYRKKGSFESTHFSEIETTEGDTFSSQNVFNTLGPSWLFNHIGSWYPSDKRVFIEI